MTLSDSVQMPIGCRNWHNLLSFAAGKNFDLSIWLDRTQRCPVLVTKKDSFERQNLSTCMAHLSVELIPKKFSWPPRNVTGKCIPHAETCCRSFAMNAHTSWFLACLPLSAQRHPFPREKRQSLRCPSSRRISVHRRRTANFQRMAVFQIPETDFIKLYVIRSISGFWGMKSRSLASPLFLQQSPRMAGGVD